MVQCTTWWFNVPRAWVRLSHLLIFSGNYFDIYLCYSIIIDNDIFIQCMDITGSQFLDLAQIFLEKTKKI